MPMNDENFQGDFFDGESFEKKIITKPFIKKLSGERLVRNFRVPVESLIISLIIVLILMVVSFSIGVERGKWLISGSSLMNADNVDIKVMPVNSAISERGADFGVNESLLDKAQNLRVKTGKVEINNIEDTSTDGPAPAEIDKKDENVGYKYIIQVATYKNEASADTLVKELTKDGKIAAFAKKGAWHQVYIKGFKDIGSAEKTLKDLKKRFPDCYIREVENYNL